MRGRRSCVCLLYSSFPLWCAEGEGRRVLPVPVEIKYNAGGQWLVYVSLIPFPMNVTCKSFMYFSWPLSYIVNVWGMNVICFGSFDRQTVISLRRADFARVSHAAYFPTAHNAPSLVDCLGIHLLVLERPTDRDPVTVSISSLQDW
jgi:hypothetical protein